MSAVASAATFKKIKHLEKVRKISFADGVERYITGSEDEKIDYFMFYVLFDELHKVSGDTLNAR